MPDDLVVAVLGSGNGGMATAADLSLRGFRVRLFDLPEFESSLQPVRAAGGIALEVLECAGLVPGFAVPELITTDIEEAVRGAQVILIIVPSYAHGSFARLLAPVVQPGQVVVLSPGNLAGAIEFALAFKARGRGDVLVAETESMIYACRKKDPATVWIRGYKHGLRIAALPSRFTPVVLELMQRLYPELEPAENVLETGLSNANPYCHVPLMLMNAGLIERTGGDFLFYHEGMTSAIGKAVEALDRERLSLGKALGLSNMRSLRDQDIAWYGHQGVFGNNVHETSVNNPIYRWSKAPSILDHRYLTEDVPYGLVPVESLGRWAKVKTTVTSALIDLACVVLERDLRAAGRTLERLGLSFATLEELRRVVDESGV